ncbi:hypothetical protein FCN77_01090 [Arthrobacter sp. 24S4-2]|uniref:hypothetical protein n=1 Tax=Arthrobacter sp. 24S4-2 TaxID=2575374 RepID=UPI0010C7985B|nr:hypothetical protein [Arthrobacter sp. 24S4-2]QCO96572.1 hypothetical protein FCN77_01090 [Arthrobacter sp. 24S4-2]
MPAPGTLVFLRRGQSVLNAQKRFTGLPDPPLTRDTTRMVLDVLGAAAAPSLAAWELNERSNGSLTGRDRSELLSELGPEVFRFWHQHLRPRIREEEDVLVIGHGNALRALCLVLDRLSHVEVEVLNIPTGHPLAYQVSPDLVPVVRGGEYLNPLAAAVRAGRPGRNLR